MQKEMLRLIAVIVAMLMCVAQGFSRTATDFFKSAPDSLIRLLPQSVRLDMIDYFNFGSTHSSPNAFNGSARMGSVSDAVISFYVDRYVNMQIAVIPAKNDTILAVVTTLNLPALDSSIEFYDSFWNRLSKAPFVMPGYDEWLNQDGRDDRTAVEMYLPFIPVSASFDPDCKTLLLTNEAFKYMEELDYDKIKHLIVGSMLYDIVNGRFILHR